MFRSIRELGIAVIVVLCLPGGWAQAQTQQPENRSVQPIPPVAPLGPVTADAQEVRQEPPAQIDSSPKAVTGALASAIGVAGDRRSTLALGLHAGEYMDSNALGTSQPSARLYSTDLGGHFDLRKEGRQSNLMLSYQGGALLYDHNRQYDSSYHTLELAEGLRFRRWSLHVDDQFSYMPESPFGFGGGGIGGLGNGLLSSLILLNPNVTPDQSILTPQTRRISNNVVAQVEIDTSRRTTWTFSGGYGFLDFMNSAYLKPSSYNFIVGYNHMLSARDVVGFSYQVNLYRFSSHVASIDDHLADLTYSHSFSGHSSFSAAVGPDYDRFKSPSAAKPNSKLSYNANLAVTYRYNRAIFEVSGYRYIGAGAGVLLGAATTGAQFAASRQLGRRWNLSAAAGYSMIQALSQTSSTNSSYQGWYTGATAARNVARSTSLFVRYDFQHQGTQGPPCGGVLCVGQFHRHEVGIGISWELHPVSID